MVRLYYAVSRIVNSDIIIREQPPKQLFMIEHTSDSCKGAARRLRDRVRFPGQHIVSMTIHVSLFADNVFSLCLNFICNTVLNSLI